MLPAEHRILEGNPESRPAPSGRSRPYKPWVIERWAQSSRSIAKITERTVALAKEVVYPPKYRKVLVVLIFREQIKYYETWNWRILISLIPSKILAALIIHIRTKCKSFKNCPVGI